MRRSSTHLLLLLAAAAAFGLDLTTFRQSYSRVGRADWYVSAVANTEGWIGSPVSHAAGVGGILDWRTAILSDNLDLDAESQAYLAAGAQDGIQSDTIPATGRRVSATATLRPTATCHAYLPGTDVFVRAGLDAGGSFDVDDERDGPEWDKSRVLRFDLYNGQIGLGYGRMRDAWPLYRAARLARILKEEGVLIRELSDDDLRDLGGLLSRSWKLFYAHDRAAKFYYDSLEQWLTRAGAIREPLPAYTLFRLDETPLIGSDERRFGMRGFLTADIDAHFRSESYDVTDTAWAEIDTSFHRSYQVGWEFRRLVGLRWTYGASAAYVLPWPRTQPRVEHRLELTGDASYDITDRLVASYALEIAPYYSPAPQAYWDNLFALPSAQTLVFSYYVSERFAVRLGGRYDTGFDLQYGEHYSHADFRHRWAAALTMTFGRIPSGWGVHYYL
jgi:hypothetical protein